MSERHESGTYHVTASWREGDSMVVTEEIVEADDAHDAVETAADRNGWPFDAEHTVEEVPN